MNCLAIIIIIITDAYWLQVFDSNYSTRDGKYQSTYGHLKEANRKPVQEDELIETQKSIMERIQTESETEIKKNR
jgi:hypothetical protein